MWILSGAKLKDLCRWEVAGYRHFPGLPRSSVWNWNSCLPVAAGESSSSRHNASERDGTRRKGCAGGGRGGGTDVERERVHRQGVVDLEEEEGKNSNTWPLLGTGEIASKFGWESGIGHRKRLWHSGPVSGESGATFSGLTMFVKE